MHVLAEKDINFQRQMQQIIKVKYVNLNLQIGMANWREMYLLKPNIVRLYPETDKGRLVYRAKGSAKRISHAQIKIGLVKKSYHFVEDVPDWLLG
jgi:hypothetical protein